MSDFLTIIKDKGLGLFLKEAKIKTPTAVQEKVIPLFLKGETLEVVAKTGAGKTLSFALPLIQKLKEEELKKNKQEELLGAPSAIVLAPTRELARQLYFIFKSISHHAKLRVRFLGGGEGFKKLALLKKESFDVLISVPGKLIHNLDRKHIITDNLKYLILDEADQLLESSFFKDILTINKKIDLTNLQVGLFGATGTLDFVKKIKEAFPSIIFKRIVVDQENTLVPHLETFNMFIEASEKENVLKNFVKKKAKGKGIIFVNRQNEAVKIFNELCESVKHQNFIVLHGEMSAKDRKEAFERFVKEDGVLIATDIAARGIDIKDLYWVLNYDLPFEAVYYVHRSGRAGRGMKSGRVYNFITKFDTNLIARINTAIKNQTSLKLSTIKLKEVDERFTPGFAQRKKEEEKKRYLHNVKKQMKRPQRRKK